MVLAINLELILEKLILIVVVVSASLVIAMYTTFAERKVAAILQDRRGPNRAGPFGLLQPLADGLKLFFKEEIIPDFSSKFLFILGPALAMLTATMTSAVIPWGDKVHLFGRDISLQIADVTGRIVKDLGIRATGADGSVMTIDVSSLTTGSYRLIMSTTNAYTSLPLQIVRCFLVLGTCSP